MLSQSVSEITVDAAAEDAAGDAESAEKGRQPQGGKEDAGDDFVDDTLPPFHGSYVDTIRAGDNFSGLAVTLLTDPNGLERWCRVADATGVIDCSMPGFPNPQVWRPKVEILNPKP